MIDPLLSVENLSVEFGHGPRALRVVENVSFSIARSGTLGIVGESGSGKSVTSLAIMRLIADPPGRIAGGRILFERRDLASVPSDEIPDLRGRDIAMIFQEPMSSLNPVMTIGEQISEGLVLHEGGTPGSHRGRVIELLRLIGMPDPESRYNSYPHQFSGGMRQRVMIAMAIACNPKLLIADEPTTALDVTIQAQVLDLMRSIRSRLGMAILIISHDLGVIAEIAEHVVVMYAGRVVEAGDIRAIFGAPGHPYTKGLMQSVPRLRDTRRRLYQIPGTVPVAGSIRRGCPFAPRCESRLPRCTEDMPPAYRLGPDHSAACWLHEGKPSTPESYRP